MFIAFTTRTVGHFWYRLIRSVEGFTVINNRDEFIITRSGSFIVEVISFCTGSGGIFSTKV